MANTIRIKRSTGSTAPSSLANAELAYAEGSDALYVGVGTGGAGGTATVVKQIGGGGLWSAKTANTFYAGPTTGSAATPAFRAIVAGDLPDLSGTYLTVSTASSTYAPLASPALTGTPTATTATVDTNSTRIATTAFVIGQASAATPAALGTAAIGTSTRYARADHVHAMPTRSQIGDPTADVSNAGFKLTNVADPTAAQDAATKNYVDSVAQGLDVKASVVCATTANITLSGLQTIDGITVVAGDRVLVKNQSSASANGIYTAASGAWTRATDADTWNELISAFTFVERGTTQSDTGWVSTVDAGGTLGTTSVTWAQFSGAGSYLAGNGLALTGSTFSVQANGTTIDVSSSGIRLSATYAGQNTITTLGTVTTGVWNASVVGVQYGGTGAATLTGYVKGSGTSALTASATIPNTDITGLGTMSTQAASNVTITGGSIDGITIDGGTF